MPATILAFSGSSRAGSLNKTVLALAIEGARAAGATVTELDLRDLNLPLYDGDLEAASGLPEGARRFKALLQSHAGLLIASPEYNSLPTPLLVNALDWASRREPTDPPAPIFKGKVVAFVAASPGGLGGTRALPALRNSLMNQQALVLPGELAVPAADKALGPDGRFTDAKRTEAAQAVGAGLARFLDRT